MSALVVLCTLGLRGVLGKVGPDFERQSRHRLDVRYESSNALMRRIADRERADLAIMTDAAIAALTTQGKIAAGSRADLALSRVGLGVRAGAPKPDISTIDGFMRALREARSIAYTQTGASGIHFASVIQRLGIADEVNRKARVQDGFSGALAVAGEVELAVQQLSELAAVEGLEIIGPIPEELQQVTTFSAGVFADAAQPDAARALIAFLASAAVAPEMRARGLEPIDRA
jgi:molybdate transport system substrate-binding protein